MDKIKINRNIFSLFEGHEFLSVSHIQRWYETTNLIYVYQHIKYQYDISLDQSDLSHRQRWYQLGRGVVTVFYHTLSFWVVGIPGTALKQILYLKTYPFCETFFQLSAPQKFCLLSILKELIEFVWLLTIIEQFNCFNLKSLVYKELY